MMITKTICDSCGEDVKPEEQNANSTPQAIFAKQSFDFCTTCGSLLLLALKEHTLRKKLEP